MKLKFKAEPQDVLIFVLFAILLFFIVALGIANIYSLAQTGYFAGLNIGLAFTSRITFYLTFVHGVRCDSVYGLNMLIQLLDHHIKISTKDCVWTPFA